MWCDCAGYGDAINAYTAAEFLRAYMEADALSRVGFSAASGETESTVRV